MFENEVDQLHIYPFRQQRSRHTENKQTYRQLKSRNAYKQTVRETAIQTADSEHTDMHTTDRQTSREADVQITNKQTARQKCSQTDSREAKGRLHRSRCADNRLGGGGGGTPVKK